MNCLEAREALLIGDENPDLEAHCDGCIECGADRALLHQTQRRLFDELDAFVEDHHAFERAWAEAQHTPPTPKRYFTMTNLLVAAAAVATIALAASVPTTGHHEPAAETTAPKLDTTVAKTIEPLRWNAVTQAAWMEHAEALYPQLEQIRKHDLTSDEAFLIAVQTGRAAENANNPVSPFFQEVPAGFQVNIGYYEAARMAKADPTLLESLQDQSKRSISRMIELLAAEDLKTQDSKPAEH